MRWPWNWTWAPEPVSLVLALGGVAAVSFTGGFVIGVMLGAQL